jgi:hypothetical protein
VSKILKFAPRNKFIKILYEKFKFYSITFSYKFPLSFKSLIFKFNKALISSKSPKSACCGGRLR